MAKQSHPLNSIITDISNRSENEKNKVCYLIDIYSHMLFEQITHFQLPGYLEFPYENRHFDPIINTDLGFQVTEATNTYINDFFNRPHSSL